MGLQGLRGPVGVGRDCRAVVVRIWGIPGVLWATAVVSTAGLGLLAGPCRKLPAAQGLERRMLRRPDLGTSLCQEEGSPLSWGDPVQEGRAAGGADWARGGSCPGWRGGRARGPNLARRRDL